MQLVILVLGVLAVALYAYKKSGSPEGSRKSQEPTGPSLAVVTAERAEQLPEPVQKWLAWSGSVGKDEARSMYLKQSGQVKLKPEQKQWTSAKAEQYTTFEPPEFTWKVDMKMAPGTHISGKDVFRNGRAQMRIKFDGIMPLSKTEKSYKTNQSALQRYLMELSCCPPAALSSYVSWQKVDSTTATAEMELNGVSGTADFHFDAQGELKSVNALRYKDSDEKAEMLPCTAHILSYMEVGGIKVPSKIEIVWDLPDGPFTWYRFEVSDVQFNQPAPAGWH
ncbi:MAG TPA: DUF6544 family protein [Planococcus sp. (in: firmicutes)]|nr:DUF6544 family protein [Planococcus sp. (in: firmicutes)]